MRLQPPCVAAIVVVLSLLACLPASVVEAGAVETKRPNVVFILADDLGYGDVKCFGRDRCQIETPHFDRLAREGMRFTNAHSICSVCVPSRIGIMTGRYAWRFGSPAPGGPWGFLGTRLAVGRHTIGSMMKSAGYRTGYVGKWHLGTLMQTTNGKVQGTNNVDYSKPLKIGPPQYGFHDSFILPGSLDMYPYVFVRNNQWVGQVTAQKGWSAFNRIGPAAEDFEDYKVLDTFCGEAERFIAQQSDASKASAPKANVSEPRQPFFLYLALTAPHTPLSPSEGFQGKSRLGVYGDFVMETDDCVGRMLAALDQHGLAENTLVIATSDHGAALYAGRSRKAITGQMRELEKDGHYASGIQRGYKFSVYEGGFHVPFAVRWPGVVDRGTTCNRLIGLHDLMATLADVAGTKLADREGPDSISLLPLLRDASAQPPRRSMIVQASQGMAIHSGDWKLVFCPGSGCSDRSLIPVGHEQSWKQAVAAYGKKVANRDELFQPPFVQLFNLADDPSETTNVAADHPEKIREMRELFQSQVDSGRSTPGQALENDRDNIRAFRAVPANVWQKPSVSAEKEKDLGLQLSENPPMRSISRKPPAPAPIADTFEIREGFTLIETLDEFRAAIKKDGQKIRMKPGVYRAEKVDPPMMAPIPRTQPDAEGNLPKNRQEHIFAVNGSNNHFDLRGVVLETPVSVQSKLSGRAHVADSWHINGAGNTFEGGYFRNIIDRPYPNYQVTENEFEVCNDDNTFLDCTFVVTGSIPYGYTDYYGKGGPNFGRLNKHSFMSIYRANNTRLIGCRVYMKTFGHCVHFHQADGVLIKGCFFTGTLRPTNDILKEKVGRAKEYDFNVMYRGKRPIPRDEMIPLTEDGVRSYGGDRNITVIDTTVERLRGCFQLLCDGDVTLENVTVLEAGDFSFDLSSGDQGKVVMKNCRADVAYNPLFNLTRGPIPKDAFYEVTILSPARGVRPTPRTNLGTICGDHCTFVFHDGTTRPLPEEVNRINCGGKHGLINSTVTNNTPARLILSERVRNCVIKSVGPVEDHGSENTIVKINPGGEGK